MKDKILKLLKSPVYEDVILGLNLIRDWDWEEIQNLKDEDAMYRGVRIKIEHRLVPSTSKKFKLNGSIICHFNNALWFYPDFVPNDLTEYIQL